jgi:hypothetical protein
VLARRFFEALVLRFLIRIRRLLLRHFASSLDQGLGT